MKVTCKQKTAEKVYSRKSYVPKFDIGIFFFFQKMTHATSNAAKIFLIREQKNSIILNIKIVPFDQKNLYKTYVSFLF